MTQLTPNDPVSKDTLEQLRQLRDVKGDLALKLLSLEQEKIRILASHRRVEDHLTRLFETILVERGLSPETDIEIDPQTGVLKVVSPEVAPAKPVEEAKEATAEPKA